METRRQRQESPERTSSHRAARQGHLLGPAAAAAAVACCLGASLLAAAGGSALLALVGVALPVASVVGIGGRLAWRLVRQAARPVARPARGARPARDAKSARFLECQR